MRKIVLDQVYELAKKDKRIVYIGSDLGAGILDNFKKEMPERFFMEGVSEQALIGMSAGLAMEGKIVYFNTIATFITRRCFEQVVLDLGLHNANVRLIANGGGVVYAPLGPTHLAIDDIGILRTIPNMTILAPCDANEMKRLMPQTVNHKGPIYIRLAKGGDPIISSDAVCTIGKAIVMKESEGNTLLIGTGITTKLCLDAAEQHTTVLHVHTIKPLDKETILHHAKKAKSIVVIEEHSTIAGLGSAVAELLMEAGIHARFKKIGFPDVFPEGYGSQAQVMQKYGITSQNIVETIKGWIC